MLPGRGPPRARNPRGLGRLLVSQQLTEADERLLRDRRQQQEQQEQQPQRQERGEEEPEGLRGLHVRSSAAAEGSADVYAPAGGSTLALAMVVH